MAALTPSPASSSPDSDAAEPAEEQSVGEEEDLEDDVFPERMPCDGRDPFYDRPPLFSVVGRLVRSRTACWEGTSSFAQEHCCGHDLTAVRARPPASGASPGQGVRGRGGSWPSCRGPSDGGGQGAPGHGLLTGGPVSAERPPGLGKSNAPARSGPTGAFGKAEPCIFAAPPPHPGQRGFPSLRCFPEEMESPGLLPVPLPSLWGEGQKLEPAVPGGREGRAGARAVEGPPSEALGPGQPGLSLSQSLSLLTPSAGDGASGRVPS